MSCIFLHAGVGQCLKCCLLFAIYF